MGIQESMGKLPQKQVDQIMILLGGNYDGKIYKRICELSEEKCF